MTDLTSIHLWFESLHVSRVREGGGADVLPLSALSDSDRDHVHGGLRIEIGGRLVPQLGHFGDSDDVCFAIWLQQLRRVAEVSKMRFTISTKAKKANPPSSLNARVKAVTFRSWIRRSRGLWRPQVAASGIRCREVSERIRTFSKRVHYNIAPGRTRLCREVDCKALEPTSSATRNRLHTKLGHALILRCSPPTLRASTNPPCCMLDPECFK